MVKIERSFLNITALIKFIAALLIISTNIAQAKPIIIDINDKENPCEEIRKGFKKYWLNSYTNSFQAQAIQIRGSATVKMNDLIDMGDYALCAGLGRGLHGDSIDFEKISKLKIKFEKSINFDDVILTFEPGNQNKPVVIFQWGSFYNIGWWGSDLSWRLGEIHVGGRVKGDLTIYTKGKQSGKWKNGMMPSLPFSDGNISDTSMIAWFETGIMRADMTRLSLTVEALNKDYDDIGLLHQHSWGVRRGPMRFENLGVGMLFYGNSVGSVTNSYLHRNAYGLILGDLKIGGDVVPSPNCSAGIHYADAKTYCKRRNFQVVGLSVSDSVIEGNVFGNLIINDAARIEFNSVHFEMAMLKHQRGHGVLIGGGYCSKDGLLACASDFECKKGSCDFSDKTLLQSIRFYGGIIGGDRFSNQWDGFVIGENAKQGRRVGSQIYLENFLNISDLDESQQIKNACYAPNVKCGIINYKDKASIHIDHSKAVFNKNAIVIYKIKN